MDNNVDENKFCRLTILLSAWTIEIFCIIIIF